MAVASKASAALEALRAAALAAGVDVSGWAGSVGPAAAAVPGPAGAPLEWTAFGAAVAADWDDWADEGFDVVDALPPDGDDDDDDDDGSDDDVARAALSSAIEVAAKKGTSKSKSLAATTAAADRADSSAAPSTATAAMSVSSSDDDAGRGVGDGGSSVPSAPAGWAAF